MAAWHFLPARRPAWTGRHTRPRPQAAQRHTPRWRRWLRLWVIAFCALLIVRALLPLGVRAWVNHVLAGMQRYRGEIDAIRLNLWRGAYELDNLRLFKRDDATGEPFVAMRRLDIAIQWNGLLHGRIVAEATAHHPVLEFAKLAPAATGAPAATPQPTASQRTATQEPGPQDRTGKDEPWALHLDELAPFEINRFVIRDGEIRYRNETRDPPVDFYVTDFYLEALNIANVRDKPGEEVLLAEIEAAGRPFGTGELEIRMRFDPLAEPLRMELDAAARDIQLTDINDYLRSYASVDAESGTLGLYAEFAASDGIVEGYVKTLFDQMRILRFRDVTAPRAALDALWQALVSVAAFVFENQPHDRLATRIPLRGTLSDTGPDLFATIANLLGNAFLAALGPAIDDSIELKDMKVVPPRAGAKGREQDGER